jgi:glycine/D-amino acid oxidase-like deaminating enzyme
MDIDYLIIGQGIAGTLLSYELLRAGKKVIVIDEPSVNKASLVAGAVINPMIGKSWTPALHQDIFIPEAMDTYKSLEKILGTPVIKESSLLAFHENEANEKIFNASQINNSNNLHLLDSKQLTSLKEHFRFENTVGCVAPVWLIDAENLLQYWRNYLNTRNILLAEKFHFDDCQISERNVQYKTIKADKIIFCEGAVARNNPLFNALPFTKNRGEALLLSIPHLSTEQVYHQRLRLIPRADGLFWCGSNYLWAFDNLQPSNEWRRQAEVQLKKWLCLPFEIHNHIVAERPTTAGQIPLIGYHSSSPRIAIFNGLGTRGFSAGPFWAKQICNQLIG